MKRLLVDYKKLSPETAALLLDTYPDGYGDDDIISFKNGNGEIIQAVELRTDDTLYLVKIGTALSHFISRLSEDLEIESQASEAVSEEDAALERQFEAELKSALEEEEEPEEVVENKEEQDPDAALDAQLDADF